MSDWTEGFVAGQTDSEAAMDRLWHDGFNLGYRQGTIDQKLYARLNNAASFLMGTVIMGMITVLILNGQS